MLGQSSCPVFSAAPMDPSLSVSVCADWATALWPSAPHTNIAEVCLITEPNVSRCCLMLLQPQRSSCLLPQRSQGGSTSLEALHLGVHGEDIEMMSPTVGICSLPANHHKACWWCHCICLKDSLCFSICIAYVSLCVAPSTTSQNLELPIEGTICQWKRDHFHWCFYNFILYCNFYHYQLIYIYSLSVWSCSICSKRLIE